jgi:formylglycine-generating enzyme required for sulfatase activity
MLFPKRIIAVLLIVASAVAGIPVFGQDGGKPYALAGKSRPQTETVKKPFPWLLVGGIAAAGVLVAILLLKKKKDAPLPSGPMGNIRVVSTPSGARISLDSKDIGLTTDTVIRNIPTGGHMVALTLQGYDQYVQAVTVEAGQTAEVEATLSVYAVKEPVMVRLPGGTFMMGSESSEALWDEKPVHQVTLSSFEIGKYEVTQAEWISIMSSNPSMFKGSRLPVENVTWAAVQIYIDTLNDKTGRRYRLPTEAEWEYACRAGTTGDRYGDLDAIAWYPANSGGLTHEVGGKAPNAFGLYDMIGNVWEWVHECYGPYSPEPAVNPRGDSQNCDESAGIPNIHHVVRGGSWVHETVCLRAPFRNIHYHHFDVLGFRLARD